MSNHIIDVRNRLAKRSKQSPVKNRRAKKLE